MVLWRDDHSKICWYFYDFDYYALLWFYVVVQKKDSHISVHIGNKWYMDTNISIFLIANTDLYKSCNQSIKPDKNFFVHRLVKSCLLSQGQKLKQKRTTIRYWDGQLNYPNVYASKWNREGMTLHFLSFLDGPFYNCYQNIRQQSNEKSNICNWPIIRAIFIGHGHKDINNLLYLFEK